MKPGEKSPLITSKFSRIDQITQFCLKYPKNFNQSQGVKRNRY